MQKVRLKAIKLDVDFRKSEMTNYDEWARKKSFPGELRANEVYLFMSKRHNQFVWILHDLEVSKNERGHRVFDSRRWRLETGTWNPLMLANYAEEVGLQLEGLRKFEQIYDDSRKKKTRKSST